MASTTKEIMLALASSKAEATSKRPLLISMAAKANCSEELLDNVVEAIIETHDTLPITSALPGFEHNAVAVDVARHRANDMVSVRVKELTEIKEKLLIKLFNLALKAQGAGNCYEFSLYAHSLLARRDIRSELFRVRGSEGDNHVFLVLNRDPSTSAEKFHEWNSNTLVVDPYLKKIYLGLEIPKTLETCLYNEATGVISYLPFHSEESRLDNTILPELVEDWRAVLTSASTHTRTMAAVGDAAGGAGKDESTETHPRLKS